MLMEHKRGRMEIVELQDLAAPASDVWSLVGGEKVAPEDRSLAEGSERLSRDLRGGAAFWEIAGIGEDARQIGDRTDAIERCRLRPPIHEIGIRKI